MTFLTKQLVEELFTYSDGKLFWKKDVAKNVKAGDEVAKESNVARYKKATIGKKSFSIHRIIYFMHTGVLPKSIDHINGNTKDNRIENLREATFQQNSMNKKTSVNSKSGIKNVYYRANKGLWRVCVKKPNGKIFEKLFKDLELAELVAIEARDKFHGKFANHGSIA